MSLPPFNQHGDLPIGVHPATLREVIARFGVDSPHRMMMALRLEHIYRLAISTGRLARFVVFGSFITAKAEPNDVDVLLLMEDTFDAQMLTGELRLLFDNSMAQAHFGASVFWLRRLATFASEQDTIEYWQFKRDLSLRGIVEIVKEQAMIHNDHELEASLQRIARFQAQAAHLRKVELNPTNYRLSVGGFLAEIDRMQLEVREYLSLHPTEVSAGQLQT